MFKNWKRIAGQAAARADALESEKRAIEHRNDYLRAERVKMLKELDARRAEQMKLVKERDQAQEIIDIVQRSCLSWRRECNALTERLEQIAACETPSANGTVRRMARIARDKDAAALVRVDAGPVPKSTREGQELKEALHECLDGTTDICAAFTWRNSKQGEDYWLARDRDGLDDEAREIIKTWIVELEAKQ